MTRLLYEFEQVSVSVQKLKCVHCATFLEPNGYTVVSVSDYT